MTTICRLCLGNSSDMLALFETFVGEKLLTEVILSTLGVELDISLDFPQFVCQDCFNNVNLLYEFCQKLIETQSLLSQWKREGKPMIKTTDGPNVITSQENSNENLEISQKKDSIIHSSIIETAVTDNDKGLSGINKQHDKIVGFVQEQIERESITIKNEPIKSDNEEMNDDDNDETTNRNANPVVSKRRRIRRKTPRAIPFKCYICGPVFEGDIEYKVHLESHKEMLPYECKQCTTVERSIVFSTVYLLNKHIESHNFTITCQLCPLRFRANNSLFYHMRTVHREKSREYNCEDCEKVFNNEFIYQNHKRGHLLLITERYKCEDCHKVFRTMQSLQRHYPVHAGKRRNVCQWCSLTFLSSASYLEHVDKCVYKRL